MYEACDAEKDFHLFCVQKKPKIAVALTKRTRLRNCWQLRLFCLLLDNRILSLGLGLKNLQIVQSIGIVCLPFLLSMPALFSDCCNYFKLMSQSC